MKEATMMVGDSGSRVIHKAALAAHRAGIPVVPAREDGSRRPDLPSWKQYRDRLPTLAQVKGWFGSGRRTGMCVILGGVGGVRCLDFDDAEVWERYQQRAAEAGLGDLLARVTAGYLERTPGGVHILYRCHG